MGVESTVLDISGEKPLILRPGAVTLEDIERILGETSLCDWRNTSDSVEEKPKSPGMKYTHYSPDADVVIYEGDGEVVCRSIRIDAMSCMLKGEKIGIMTVDENRHFYELLPNVLSLGSRGNPHAQAANLFKLLRRFDELGVEKVFAEAVPADGMGNAVMNRMFRAAGGNVKNAAGGEAVK